MTSEPSKKFQDLILGFSQAEDMDVRKRIEATLWEAYGIERAVFVLDMSSFSWLTRQYGIVHYLSMIKRMQLTSAPIIKSYSGSIIKYEADSCIAIFPDALAAVEAAKAMQHAFVASNLMTSADVDIYISCGIDYGRILLIQGEDCFGDAVNRASKLGEDIASAGEILITKEAMETIPSEMDIKVQSREISVSGITLTAYAIQY